MNTAIVSREDIRALARGAFKAGKGRDAHGMNWHAAALPTWLKEYDRLATEQRHDADRQFFRVITEGKPT